MLMKFDNQRVNLANSERIQLADPQFLTFRHSSQNNNTGRSIFSQKIQIYKSLEKGEEKFQDSNAPVRNFKKSNNLRSIRSQQKYQGKMYLSTKIPGEIQNKNDNEQSNNNTGEGNEEEFRNEILRKKIQKLIKNLKSQQKKESSLEKDIEQLQRQIEQDQKQIQRQITNIQQLQGIKEYNEEYLQRLSVQKQENEQRNGVLEEELSQIQSRLQSLMNTGRQQQMKQKTVERLKQGLRKIQNLRQQLNKRCVKVEGEIQRMKDLIEETENVDLMIRDVTYTREGENNSHFTC